MFFVFLKVSPKLKSFIEACLQKDPFRRSSAFELLQHPFLRLASPPSAIATLVKDSKSWRGYCVLWYAYFLLRMYVWFCVVLAVVHTTGERCWNMCCSIVMHMLSRRHTLMLCSVIVCCTPCCLVLITWKIGFGIFYFIKEKANVMCYA